jgi:hypothetical protein
MRNAKDRGLISYRVSEERNAKLWGNRGLAISLFAGLLGLMPAQASAQLNSKTATVSLNAALSSSITVTAAPGLVNFNLPPSGVSNGSVPVSITTSWVLPILFGQVTEYAYFASPAAALADGVGDNIPSANVSGSFDGGAFTAFAGTSPFAAGSSMTLFNQFVLILFNASATRTDTLNLRIDTTGLGLPAATYTGVLHIQAQAI